MKLIRSRNELLKKLKKTNIAIDMVSAPHLTDYHKTPVSTSLFYWFLEKGFIEPTKALSEWYEKEYRLKTEFLKLKEVSK